MDLTIEDSFAGFFYMWMMTITDSSAWWYPVFYQIAEASSMVYVTIAHVFPIAIPIIGIGLIVMLGVNLFKRVANKA